MASDDAVTFHIDWDAENCNGTPHRAVDFLYHLKGALPHRFPTHRVPWYRVQVYHNPLIEKHNLNRWHSFDQAGKKVTLRNKLHQMDCTLIDIGGREKQQADECIHKHMRELREDLGAVASRHVYILVSSDGGFLPHLRQMLNVGFNVFLISNFDCISNHLLHTPWLEIWSFYSIARGDTCKVRAVEAERGMHPKFKTMKYPDVQIWSENPYGDLEVEDYDDEEEEEEEEEDNHALTQSKSKGYKTEFPPLPPPKAPVKVYSLSTSKMKELTSLTLLKTA